MVYKSCEEWQMLRIVDRTSGIISATMPQVLIVTSSFPDSASFAIQTLELDDCSRDGYGSFLHILSVGDMDAEDGDCSGSEDYCVMVKSRSGDRL